MGGNWSNGFKWLFIKLYDKENVLAYLCWSELNYPILIEPVHSGLMLCSLQVIKKCHFLKDLYTISIEKVLYEDFNNRSLFVGISELSLVFLDFIFLDGTK